VTRTAYLDTNAVIGLVEEDLDEVESTALRELLRLRKSGTVNLVTSHITKEELEKMLSTDKRRRQGDHLPTARRCSGRGRASGDRSDARLWNSWL